MSAPYVDAEGEFEEQVKTPKVAYLAEPMPPIEFSSLKAGAKLMLYSQPPACDSAYYQPIEIIGSLRRCYLVTRDTAFARVSDQLIPATAL